MEISPVTGVVPLHKLTSCNKCCNRSRSVVEDHAPKAASAAALRGEPQAASQQKKKKARAAGAGAAVPPPLSATLADGSAVDYHTSESWSVVGCELTIPESAWGVSGSARHRYALRGISTDSGEPLYVAEVLRGSLAGQAYLVGAQVVRALMTTTMRKAAGSCLQRPPQPS